MPIESATFFKFSSLEAGLLFLCLGVPSIFISPLAGWAIDLLGTRFVAVLGMGLLVPSLALLILPETLTTIISYNHNVAFFVTILVLNGISNSIAGAPGIVEACSVVEEHVRAAPELFYLLPAHFRVDEGGRDDRDHGLGLGNV